MTEGVLGAHLRVIPDAGPEIACCRGGMDTSFTGLLLQTVLDPVFGHPKGTCGRLGGAIMARSNARAERSVVDQAKLAGDETVVVIGPGPGVGLRAAGEATPRGRVIGVEPSEVMRDLAGLRCSWLVRTGRVELVNGTAEATGLPDDCADVALAVNNVHIWPDRPAGFTELRRILRPGGLLLVSVHVWAVGEIGQDGLRREVDRAGFADVQAYTMTQDSPAGAVVQVRATAPMK